MARPRKRVLGGVPKTEPGDMMDLTDARQIEASENFLSSEDLEDLELEDLAPIAEVDEEGFGNYHEAGKYGRVIMTDREVTRPQAFGITGEEVEFTGITPPVVVEPVEIKVRPEVIAACEKLAQEHPRAKDAQNALELQAEVRKLREEMKLNKSRNEAFQAAEAVKKAQTDAKHRQQLLRQGKL
jgi:hypothetical protein